MGSLSVRAKSAVNRGTVATRKLAGPAATVRSPKLRARL